MAKKVSIYDDKVIFVHTVLVATTLLVPLVLMLLNMIEMSRCFALFGVGFFVISGHSIAFFNVYVRYLKRMDALASMSEEGIRKMLRMSVIMDMGMAIFCYLLGLRS